MTLFIFNWKLTCHRRFYLFVNITDWQLMSEGQCWFKTILLGFSGLFMSPILLLIILRNTPIYIWALQGWVTNPSSSSCLAITVLLYLHVWPITSTCIVQYCEFPILRGTQYWLNRWSDARSAVCLRPFIALSHAFRYSLLLNGLFSMRDANAHNNIFFIIKQFSEENDQWCRLITHFRG